MSAPSVTVLVSRSSCAGLFEHVAQRARAMAEAGAYLHLYRECGMDAAALYAAAAAVEALARTYRAAADPDA